MSKEEKAKDPIVGTAVDRINNIPVNIRVEVGRVRMKVRDVLSLTQGKIVVLNKLAGEALDLRMNDHLFAMGEVVTVNEHYGIRLTDILPTERIDRSGD